MNDRIRNVGGHLQIDQFPDTFPQADHAFYTLLCCCVQLGLDHAAVFPVVHFTVYQSIGEVLYIRVSGNGSVDFLTFTQIGQFCFLVGAVDVLDSFLKLLCQRNAFLGRYGVVLSESRAFGGFFSQYHVWVVQEIAVDGIAVLVLTGLHPVRLNGNGPVALLQEDDVGYHFGTGIGFEGIVGQTDGTQELRPLCQILPHIAVLGIHGIAAGDKGHDTAGT